MRVLQGVTGQAGQPYALSLGLREIGIEAETCAIHEHKFGYHSDHLIDLRGARTLTEIWNRLTPLIHRFDVFHFHARSFVAEWPQLEYPSFLDIAILKLAGKRVFFHFRGQEIRLATLFAEKNPFHYVDEPTGWLFKKMPDESKIRLRDLVTSLCDGVFVVDPELQTYVPEATVVPRALPEADWPYVGVSERIRPVVAHAPSRRGAKGTAAVIQAVDELKREGLGFEFRLVENLPHAEAVAHYRDADILIDQLRIGWYGVLATEGMALGKPVIAYIRDDLWQAHGHALPIVNANPDTVKLKLRELILSHEMRQRASQASRSYFLRVHGATKVAELLQELYQRDRPAHSLDGLVRFLDRQVLQRGAQPAQSSAVAARVLGQPALQSPGKNAARLEHFWRVWQADGSAAAYAIVRQFIVRQLKQKKA